MQKTIDEHRAVLDRIAAGDPEGARAAMAAHMIAVADLFEALARARPALIDA